MDSPAAPRKTSGLAITSLVFGILSLFCCGALAGIPAIIMGHVSRSRIKSSGDTLGGAGLALGGLITGYISLVITLLFTVAIVPQLPTILAKAKAGQTLVHGLQIQVGAQKAALWPADAKIPSSAAFIDALVEKGGLTKAEATTLSPGELQLGNVSAEDPSNTIFARSRPGLFPDGSVVVITKSGGIQFYDSETAVTVPAPPREPQFLTE
jgi:hypothetical protein